MAILRNLVLFISFLILGCSNSQSKVEQVSYQTDGLISINRQAPKISSIKTPESLAFMPVQFDSYWLKINSKLSKISLMQGSKEIKDLPFSTATKLESGSYKILIKDSNPLWYANENYYQERQLDIPLAFSSERYLKDVYGDKALFLENGMAVFSNPEEQALVSGINVNTETLETIYNNVSVDSLVVVQ